MEEQDTQMARKRKINDMEHERSEDRGELNEENGEEESEMNFSGSEEMRLGIACLHEKVEAYNQLAIMLELCYASLALVSEMLESGKSLFNKLSQDYEERVLMIHKEQIEKWQEEMKELRVIDATNEEMNDRLNNVKCLLQTVHIGQ